MKKFTFSLTSPIVFLPALIIGSLLLCWVAPKSEALEETTLRQTEIEQDTPQVSEDLMLKLRKIREGLETSSSEIHLEELCNVFREAAKRGRADRDFILQGMLKRSERLNQQVAEDRELLQKSGNDMERLIGGVQERLQQAEAQNQKWSMLSDEVKRLNAAIEQHNELKNPDYILQNALKSLTSGGGQLLRRSYHWATVIPIVGRTKEGKLQPGVYGEWDRDRTGQIIWKRRDYPDFYGVIFIPGARELFAEEDVSGINPGSPYTHIRVVGEIDLELPLDAISIKHDAQNKRLITITFPAPRLSNARFVWNGTYHGVCLVGRKSPYNLKPFITNYQDAWEKKLKHAFLTDLYEQQAINPEEFLRGVANLLAPIFEREGYAVTFFFEERDLETLMRNYMQSGE